MSDIRTRFAPSPTGSVHIGNIRVAIFNWLFSRHTGGAFLLRVEDTDRERSTPEAIANLMQAMDWLGLAADEDPLYQSARRDAHLAAADELVTQGLAYREDKGGTGRGEAVVFRMPEQDMAFEDGIKGRLEKKAENLQDFVIVRSDGNPVFHLANVLDDIDMNITHVIRGDDHIENTFRHLALYEALGAEPPVFAHLPMIVNAQGKPYAKRDGDAFVGDFRANGFLADALFNYLALLGWSPGDDREVMTREEMTQSFSLEQVQSSPAQMDMKKLQWMNGMYLQQMPPSDFEPLAEQVFADAGLSLGEEEDAYRRAALALVQSRVRMPEDAVRIGSFFFTDDYPLDEKNIRKRLNKEEPLAHLAAVRDALDDVDPFTETSLDARLAAVAEQRGCEPTKFFPPLRLAVSGQAGGPDLLPMLCLLGRERVLRRIHRALETYGHGE